MAMCKSAAIKRVIVAAMLVTSFCAITAPLFANQALANQASKQNYSQQNTTVSANTSNNSAQDPKLHPPKPGKGVPTCGSVITQSVTLQSDLHCEKDGLIVGANDVTINLNGHTLEYIGNNNQNSIDPMTNFEGNSGILVPNADNIKIIGPGEIKAFDMAIAFTGTSGGKVSDLILKGNNIGALLLGSNDIELSLLTINHNKFGIVSKSSQSGNMAFNTIVGNGKQGIVLINSENYTVAANNIFGNGENGIFLDSQSSHSKIDFNNIFGHNNADINNANGLAPNVNHNDYGPNNNCLVSIPGGLCK